MAPSTASVPELVRKTRALLLERGEGGQPLGQLEIARLVEVGGGNVDELLGLLG